MQCLKDSRNHNFKPEDLQLDVLSTSWEFVSLSRDSGGKRSDSVQP